MANALKKLPAKILDSIKKMTKGQKVRLFVLIALIIILLTVVSVFLNQKNYTVLYSGMEPSEAGDVMMVLNEMGVDAKAQGDNTILVEESVSDSVRMELAAQGYPSSGFNYGIFQNASGLGVTDMEKKVYYKFQVQENLKQTIEQMNKVDKAIVNLDLGEDSSYVLSGDETKPTASVMLTLKSGQELSSGEVQAIAELVSNSISGLSSEDVRIVDSQMNLYNASGEDAMGNADSQLALQNVVQQQLQTQIINLLSPVFGTENIQAEVNVKLNFDDKKIESVEFEPPANGTEGLVVSMSELVEAITDDSNGSVAGIDANGSASQYLEALDNTDNAAYYQVSREANYEINQTKTQIEEAKGQIEDLSVSVIINEDEADDYTDEVTDLVATAIGVDAKRITVAMLPFAGLGDAEDMQSAMDMQQQIIASMESASTTRSLIILATVLVVLIFIFAIFRMFTKKSQVAMVEGRYEYIADEEIVPDTPPKPSFDDIKLEDFEKTDNKLQILEDYIGKNPESVANLLRNWLNEE